MTVALATESKPQDGSVSGRGTKEKEPEERLEVETFGNDHEIKEILSQ